MKKIMLSQKLFCWLVYLLLVALSVDAVDHGLTRGGDSASRSLQDFQPRAWMESETVCRKSGFGENRGYKTRTIVAALWRLHEVMGMTNGVKGACEDVCPCGETGVCVSLPGDQEAGSNETTSTYQCSCADGTTSTGSSCSSFTAPEPCGGFAGISCSDESMVCIDDPSDSCDPDDGGADCIGICVATCGGFTVGPQPGCPDGSTCTNNPNTPDCLLAADCTGVCAPLPSCKLADGTGCPEGYSCTINEAADCDNSLDCPGKCAQTCGGFTEFPQIPCTSGTFCVDNPATPDCLIAADCTGVCLPPPKCSTKTGKGCWEGFSCTLDPNTACIALEGFDCPGICAPTCAGSSELQAICPDGTSCVDNPATPDCLIAADCTGVCLAPPPCILISNEGCGTGFLCTYDPTVDCIGAECPGICVPSCAGGRGNDLDCPTGSYCVDNPATPGCVIAADCFGVCLPPSQCDIESGEGCSEGFVCTIDDNSACIELEGFICPGVCAPSCAGGITPNIECPDGTECIDNPATPDCLIAADCVGVCAAPSA